MPRLMKLSAVFFSEPAPDSRIVYPNIEFEEGD